MIRDVTIGLVAPQPKTWVSQMRKLKAIKEALENHKRGIEPDNIDVSKIPF